MGKGDQRSKKGKIHIGTFGRLRPRKKATTKTATGATKAAPKKAAKKAAK
jgi:30S ribosomal protein S31